MTRLLKSTERTHRHLAPAARLASAQRPIQGSWNYGSPCAIAAVLADFDGTVLAGAPDV